MLTGVYGSQHIEPVGPVEVIRVVPRIILEFEGDHHFGPLNQLVIHRELTVFRGEAVVKGVTVFIGDILSDLDRQ